MKTASKNEMKKAIVSKCVVDCCCGDRAEAKACGIEKCPLFSISRMFLGIESEVKKEVSTKKVRKPMSDEHKAKLKAGRESAKSRKG